MTSHAEQRFDELLRSIPFAPSRKLLGTVLLWTALVGAVWLVAAHFLFQHDAVQQSLLFPLACRPWILLATSAQACMGFGLLRWHVPIMIIGALLCTTSLALAAFPLLIALVTATAQPVG